MVHRRPTPAPLKVDGSARLVSTVAPTAYRLDFRIDPRKDRFQGTTTIALDVQKPTRLLALHASDLDIVSAQARTGGKTSMGEIRLGQNEGLGLYFPEPVFGAVTLQIDYSGSLREVPMSLYRAREAERWYAFTQFEPLAARAAFPCFDEPRFKTPYSVSVVTPKDMQAFGNGPLVERRIAGNEAWHRFATTKPLPTYLVALAVGDFDAMRAPHDVDGVPLRIITTKGKGIHTRYVIEQTPKILQSLTQYFASPYPYSKLDLVAVPSFRAGAMENAGLVTFRERFLTVDTERGSEREKLRARSVIAHELAHMWFGDLVTMKWWDDLWLNEAFATWMSNRVLQDVAPEVNPELYAVTSMVDVMNHDAQLTATPIKKKIETPGDIRNAFDGITYSKGFAVLRMLENWIGETQFRDGLRAFLSRHAWQNATNQDLLNALDAASNRCVSCVAKGFIEQPGTPLLNVTLRCSDDGPASVQLEQKRYLPAEREAPPADPWQIPVCLKLGRGNRTVTECRLLAAASESRELEFSGCPDFVYPNADELGYYRWHLPESDFLDLLDKHGRQLSTAEWVALPSHAGALLEAGLLSGGGYLTTLEAAAKKQDRLVLDAVLKQLRVLERIWGGSGSRAPLQRFVVRLLRPHARRIGLHPTPGEAADHGLIREDLFMTLNELGSDAQTSRAAQKMAEQFVKSPDSVSPKEAELLVPMAAWRGNAKLHSGLVAILKQPTTPSVRATVVEALANFKDPELLEKSLMLLLDGTLRAQDYGSFMWPSLRSETLHRVFWRFFVQHEAQLIELLGPRSTGHMPWVARGFCSEEGRGEAVRQFSNLKRFGSGAQQNFAQALEFVDRCITLRKLSRPTIAEQLDRL